MTKLLRALTALCLIALVVAAAAGCGSSSGSGSGSNTAGMAPASSFFYAEATIDPSGGQESAMRSILGDLPGTGAPQDRLNKLLEKATKDDKKSPVDYAADIEPWLGDKAAVFVTPGAAKPAWAVVIASSDEGKTKDAITKGKEKGDREASYRGNDYVVDKDGTVTGVANGYFIAGSEAGFKAAVDASKGGSLADADRYKQAIKSAASDRIALVYEDTGGLVRALASASGQSLGPAAPLIGQLVGGKPVVATIRAEQQALVIDGALIPSASALKLSAGSTPLLGEVPADSWFALGLADFGSSLKTLIGFAAGIAGGEQKLEQQLEAQTGLNLNRDVLSWIGDVAVFVSGDSKDSLGGGLLIQSKDPATSKAALTKFAALAARSGGATVGAASFGKAKGYKLAVAKAPKGIYLVQSGKRVVISYGESAAKAAFGAGGSSLGTSSGFTSAASKLGPQYSPSVYMSVPPILGLVQSFGASSANYAKAEPYLSVLDYLIAGSAKSGSETASRVRLGFKPHN